MKRLDVWATSKEQESEERIYCKLSDRNQPHDSNEKSD